MIKSKLLKTKIAKDDRLEEMKVGTYFLNFDLEGDNYYFVNFDNLFELRRFISTKGLLSLYNEWLDFVCSDHVAEKVNGYMIAKVLRSTETDYSIEVIESSSKN